MKFYQKKIEDVLQYFNTSKNGLSKAEAKRRLEKYGENVIQGKKRRSKLQIFLSQFKNFMVILLLGVGVLSFFYALFETHDYLDSIVILGTTFVNILMGYLQEDKAEDAVEKLKQYSITKVQVYRDGKIEEVSSTNLVVGDIIILEAGDSVPADARIIESYFAKADESVLNLNREPWQDPVSGALHNESFIDIHTRAYQILDACYQDLVRYGYSYEVFSKYLDGRDYYGLPIGSHWQYRRPE